MHMKKAGRGLMLLLLQLNVLIVQLEANLMRYQWMDVILVQNKWTDKILPSA